MSLRTFEERDDVDPPETLILPFECGGGGRREEMASRLHLAAAAACFSYGAHPALPRAWWASPWVNKSTIRLSSTCRCFFGPSI